MQRTITHLFPQTSMNRQLQLVQRSEESDSTDLDESELNKKQLGGATTLHQSSIIWRLSLSDLLDSIKNAYSSLVILLNKIGQIARIQSINMDLVDKLITFLRPWKNILNKLQRTNTPSLFLVLPCTTYILDQLATGIKKEKSGEYNCFVSFVL